MVALINFIIGFVAISVLITPGVKAELLLQGKVDEIKKRYPDAGDHLKAARPLRGGHF